MSIAAMDSGIPEYLAFLSSYPEYGDTSTVDVIRELEFSHLDQEGQACFDYNGIGIFSHEQQMQKSSDLCFACTSSTLAAHALYQEEDTVEGLLRSRILRYLNVDQDDYAVVFAPDGLRLLTQAYHPTCSRLLLGYDYESEGLDGVRRDARAREIRVTDVAVSRPSSGIHDERLRKKLSKRHGKTVGIFAYPLVSKVTGARNPLPWISIARENGWLVALDVSGLGAVDLNLDELSPDFIIGSFYKVFASDPTGCDCLVVRKRLLKNFEEQVKMVKIVSSTQQHDRDDTRSTGMACRGLDYADRAGFKLISTRHRCLMSWLRTSFWELRHPQTGTPLVDIHSPVDAAATIAFRVLDSQGQCFDAKLVQKLASRNSISLGIGHIVTRSSKRRCSKEGTGDKISVLCASLGFVTNFCDILRLRMFISRFRDSSFCSKQLLCYQGINREPVWL